MRSRPDMPHDKLVAMVREYLMTADISRLSRERVAAVFLMSDSTFARRISPLRFWDLVIDEKKRRALEMIGSGHPSDAICYSVGYNHLQSFYRAINDWFGVSYSQMRDRHVRL